MKQDGTFLNCKMLFCFKNDRFNYIVYTNGHRTKGLLDVYAARYDIIDEKYILNDIYDDNEWDIVDEHLKTFLEGD